MKLLFYKRLSLIKKHVDVCLLVVLCCIVLLFWLPTISIPYWWDSAGFIIQSSKKLVDTNFWPLTSDFSQFAHPPLFTLFLATIWKLFGESLLVSHSVNLLFLLLLIIYIYRTSLLLFKQKPTGRLVGFFVPLLLLFTPVFLAQIGIIYIEIPMTTFAVMSYFYFLKRNHFLYGIFACFMVLTKEVALPLALLFTLLYLYYLSKNRSHRKFFKEYARGFIFSFLPFLFLFFWFLYHKLIKGWWFVIPGRTVFGLNAFIDIGKVVEVFNFLFIQQFRFVLLLFLLTFLLYVFFISKKTIKHHLNYWPISSYPLLFTPFLFVGIFAKTEFLHRYIIISLPFLYLLFYHVFFQFTKFIKIKRSTQFLSITIISIILCGLFFTQWNTHRKINFLYFQPIEDNLEYLDIIYLGLEISKYIEQNYPSSIAYTSFPTNYMLSMPHQHYVTRSIKTVECNLYKKGDHVDLIVLHTYSPGEVSCIKLFNDLEFKIIKTFEKNGKSMMIAKSKK